MDDLAVLRVNQNRAVLDIDIAVLAIRDGLDLHRFRDRRSDRDIAVENHGLGLVFQHIGLRLGRQRILADIADDGTRDRADRRADRPAHGRARSPG